MRNTWVLTAFTAITNLADGVTKVALPLMATTLTASPVVVSGVLVALTLPWLLAALHVGVLVDRADRRKLLGVANAMRIAAILGLLVAIATDVVNVPMLYAAALLLGVAEVIALTSAAAMIPDAVAPAGLERANVWVTAAETVCNEFAGPFLGGSLVAVSIMATLGASIGCYLIALAIPPLLVGHFRVTKRIGGPFSSVNKQAIEGVRFLWRQRLLRTQVLTVSILITCWAAWFAIMPLVATRRWGLSPTGYGVLVGVQGFGGIVGAVGAPVANRLFGRRWVMFVTIFFNCSMVSVPAVVANVWAVGAAAFLGGLGGTLWVVNTRIIGRTLVSADLMGRYNAVGRLFAWGSIPLGSALAGVLAQLFGYRLALGAFAVVTTAAVIVPFLRIFTREAIADIEARISSG